MITVADPMEFFADHISPEPNSGCWLWTGTLDLDGYPRMRNLLAHRFSLEIHMRKQIPDGMCVCHKCDTPCCVNPDHLFLGTNQENTADRVRKNRSARGEKSIPHRLARGEGHPMAKLTSEAVQNIRETYGPPRLGHENRDGSAKRLKLELARKHGVSFHTIDSVIHGVHWRAE